MKICVLMQRLFIVRDFCCVTLYIVLEMMCLLCTNREYTLDIFTLVNVSFDRINFALFIFSDSLYNMLASLNCSLKGLVIFPNTDLFE